MELQGCRDRIHVIFNEGLMDDDNAQHVWMSFMSRHHMVNSQWTRGPAVLITFMLVSSDLWSLQCSMELKGEVPHLLSASLLDAWAQKHAAKGPFQVHLLLSCMWAFCYSCHHPPSFDKLVTSGCLCLFIHLALFLPSFVGEWGVEAAPEPDHDGELRPAREDGHHISCGQAAAGRTR